VFLNHFAGLRAALKLANGGPVLFLYEKLPLALDALMAVHAEPWPDARRIAADAVVADAAAVVARIAEMATRATTADASADYGSITG
jgi:hypothetical protein